MALGKGVLGYSVRDPEQDLGIIISFSSLEAKPEDKIIVLYPQRNTQRMKIWMMKEVLILPESYYYVDSAYIKHMTDEVRKARQEVESILFKYKQLEKDYSLLQVALTNAADEKYKN